MTQTNAPASSHANQLAALLAVVIVGLASVNALGFRTVTGLLFNTDMLLPVDLLHDVTLGLDVAQHFQLPRVPSLFPDLAVMGLLQQICDGWRAADFAYAILSQASLVLVTAAVAARLGRLPLAQCAVISAALSALLLALGANGLGLLTPAIFALMPMIHSGSTVLVFAAILLVLPARQAVRPGLLVALGVLCFAASLSDKLFDVAFLLPSISALAAVNMQALLCNQRPARADLALAGVLVASGALSLVVDRWLFHAVLLRQPDIPLGLRDLENWQLSYAARPELWIAGLGLVGGACLLWRMRRLLEPFILWLVLATAACLMAFFLVFYVDRDSLRYLQTMFWWLIVLATMSLGQWPVGRLLASGTAIAALLAVSLLLNPARALSPPVLAWRDPQAACLVQLARAGRIHQGAGEVWTARGLEISTDWQVPVVQVANTGAPYIWGNNQLFYTQDHRNPAQSARFDFIFMRGMKPDAVRARFGPPGEIIACGPDQVWVYPSGLTLQSSG